MSDTIQSRLREALTPVFADKIPNDPEVSGVFAAITSNPERRDRHVNALASALGSLMAGNEVDYGVLVNLHRNADITPDQYDKTINLVVNGLGEYDGAQVPETFLEAELVEAYAPVSAQIKDAVVNGTLPNGYPPAA